MTIMITIILKSLAVLMAEGEGMIEEIILLKKVIILTVDKINVMKILKFQIITLEELFIKSFTMKLQKMT